jgi:hypothetical protein
MTYKKNWIDQEIFDEQAEKIGVEVGNYNTFPKPYAEIPWEQALTEMYANHMGTAVWVDHKQCNIPEFDLPGHWDVTLYMWHDKMIAVAKWYTHDEEKERARGFHHGEGLFLNKRPDGKYGGYFTRFYRIGCLHPNLYEMSADEVKERGGHHYGMFDHHYLCPDCGFTRRTDSSG